MKVLTVIGARPQFVKASVISREIAGRAGISEVLVHTGQHYDQNMSDIFFDEMKIPKPKYHLGIGGGLHGAMTGKQLEAIEKVILVEKPDWLLVYGDTNSTLAGALAAAKLHVPVAHVEAGLRSFNRNMPEEINRVLTDHISKLLFTPSNTATCNLNNEGISGEKVKQVGDVMYDVALYYRSKAQRPDVNVLDGDFILATIHRAENTDNPERLLNIFSALNKVAEETPVLLPIHPRTRKLLTESNYDIRNITLLEPVGYLQMVWLLRFCKLVVTDSGGLQKEAYFFDKPCLTTRNETEWIELLEIGANVLVDANEKLIEKNIISMLNNTEHQISSKQVYGSGNAAAQIIDML